jgi:hypothetical protein
MGPDTIIVGDLNIPSHQKPEYPDKKLTKIF